MTNELQLKTQAYNITRVGLDIQRPTTVDEWRKYGDALKAVDEAKQWAIGDWLVDGKSHYGDGLYEEASKLLGLEESYLNKLKQTSAHFKMEFRTPFLSHAHHAQVASIKKLEEREGELGYGDYDLEKQQEFLRDAEKEKYTVRELRGIVDAYKKDQQEVMRLHNSPEKYRVIYADPPWKYGNTMPDYFTEQADHYQLMSLDEIKRLPIKSIAADNAVLFLWVTSPILEESFEVVRAWGFQYKASFVWDKVSHNMGHYNSVRHELLLVCTRGACTPDEQQLFDSVVSIERGEHSEKPEEFRNIINTLYPKGNRIELFARKQTEGWDVFGNEANNVS